ncbi:pyridoxal 5'-phosphate synthase-like subunit PDX1.2 [Cicer arietinum]|uniref:Pyridoxal 5'-phosphate synthase-like subunit PDX1.2 n=1 Tax=Cicer arietinum TaxID=3827 RepID=A0A1S2YM26_CICAR|nr:pyridoxal 5'-phosphate synthase-like subunit PDX1.2 [Cicer arietinum]
MAQDTAVTVYNTTVITDPLQNQYSFKLTLRGGAIFQVTNLHQAKLAEQAGACAVIVSDQINSNSVISRMTDPSLIKQIKRVVSIPVISRARIGHFVEAQILEATGVDYIDESESLSIADDQNHINKQNFRIPFISGARNLGEALRRIREGAAMIRIQGELSNSGNVSETVKNVRCLMKELRVLSNMDDDEVFAFAKKIEAPYDLVAQTKQMGRLPVVHFAAGGIVTPADAALMMQLGCHGVFVGPEVFGYGNGFKRVRGIVQAVRNYNDPHVLVETMMGLNLGGDGDDDDDRIENVPFGADNENV